MHIKRATNVQKPPDSSAFRTLTEPTIAPTASRTTQRSARPTASRRPRELAGITYATATGMWEKHGPARLGAGAKASPVTLCTTIQATVAAVTKATNLVATTPETPVTWISSASVGRNSHPSYSGLE